MGKLRDIYEISGKAMQVKQMLDSGMIDDETFKDTLQLMISNNADIEGVANWLHHLQDREAQLAGNLKELQAEKKHTQNLASSIKACLLDYMVSTEQKNLTFEDSPVRVRKSAGRESVYIPDESKLAVAYFTTKTVQSPDKKKIADDLKAGKQVEGAELVRKPSISLK